MNNPDHIFLELRNHFFAFFGVKILKFFDEDPGSGIETVQIRDPGWKKVGSGIRDKHPGSATLRDSLIPSPKETDNEVGLATALTSWNLVTRSNVKM